MARLFGREYHEHSSTWYFRRMIFEFQKDDLEVKKYKNEEGNTIFIFSAKDHLKKYFPANVKILYDDKNAEIINHHCSECHKQNCRHYLSIIYYGYHFLKTEIIERNIVQTYQTGLLAYNEFWQRVIINALIEIGDVYDNTDKIRLYFKSFNPINIRLAALILGEGRIKSEDEPSIESVNRQIKAFSQSEQLLLQYLHKYKCAYSRKGMFFSVYKKDFIHLIPILKNLAHKVYIKETGERIEFSADDFRVNFLVSFVDEDRYSLKLSGRERISAAFVGSTSYFFIKNRVYALKLPFRDDILQKILTEGMQVRPIDIVYLSSVVARQLGLMKCYLDFDEKIEIPTVYHSTPQIIFRLKKTDGNILMKGVLSYDEIIEIPMSVIRYPSELVRYDQDDKIVWFYIPPQTKYEINEFVRKLPPADIDRIEDHSELIFSGEDKIETLKMTIFEYAQPYWKIELSDDLKKEFVYKIQLKPTIRTKSTDKIDWFDYEVKYQWKDLSFTHEEIKDFFASKQKYMKLPDGRLILFENKDAFQELDLLIKKSKKTTSQSYKLSVYNLPYIYELPALNSSIDIETDRFLQKMYNAILTRKLPEPGELPAFLQPVMRSYQKAGFQWMKMLNSFGLAGILADDMGLGKTVQAISILSTLKHNTLSLVICPKTLLFNWAYEIEKFNKNLSYVIYEGNQAERKQILKKIDARVILASYSIIQNDIESLAKIEFEYIILDEAQHIKNVNTKTTKSIKKLKSNHKLALSGTPIENNPTELWSIFDFLMPGYLPGLRTLKKGLSETSSNQQITKKRLRMMVAPFILRRKKSEVLIELPDKQEQLIYCKLTKLQEKMYLQVLSSVRKKMQQMEIEANYMHILAALTRLRQICNHPKLVEDTIKNDVELSGKTELLRELIIDAIENERKILIFSQFVQMLQILKKVLTDEKISFEYMDGSTKDRQRVIENFNNNINVRAFLISLKTGGSGLNLTAADMVIIVDPWWNPMGEAQAVDRAHRIGQTKKVMVYKTITSGTIEEKIVSLQYKKREMFNTLIEEGQSVIKGMGIDDLRKLLEN
jgi:SNF2 family DNA or RNA helicase